MPFEILILEDSLLYAQLIQATLRQGGVDFNSCVISTRDEFQQRIETGSWDLILADQALPGFSGTEALQYCQERELDIAFIFVTGTLGEEAAVQLMRQGATDCVFKDRLTRLVAAVVRAMFERAQRQEARRSREALHLATAELRAVSAVTAAFLERGSWADVAGLLLESSLAQTQSSVGLVAVVLDSGGVRIDAHRGIAWDADALSRDPAAEHFELTRMDNVPGMVIKQGTPLCLPASSAARTPFQRLPGTPAVQSCLGIPLRKGSQVLGAIVVANRGTDYTPQDQIKLELLALSASVLYDSQRRIDREAELAERLRQSQKMEAVGRLAGGVAHDFNNLLTVILGYSGTLLDSMPLLDPRRHSMTQIVRAGHQAASLTRQLLAMSRKQVLQTRVVNLNAVVSAMHEMLGRLIGEQVNFTMDLAADLGNARVDPAQIEQVLMNLVVNARDAMPGGGTLHVRTSNTELDVTAFSQGGGPVSISGGVRRPVLHAQDFEPYVEISISDTGTGIDRETQARLFEPFFTTKEAGRGTGLGLATVYGIVKQSGGHIAVDSEVGHGTTFHVYLPLVSEEASAAAEDAISTAKAKAHETILVAEDEASVREMIAGMLGGNGYRVMACSSGPEALALAQSHEGKIDLLLTDVVMPQMSGRALAERLREVMPQLRVLFMSGYTDDVLGPHGLSRTGAWLIEKPFNQEQLLARVRSALDHAGATAAA